MSAAAHGVAVGKSALADMAGCVAIGHGAQVTEPDTFVVRFGEVTITIRADGSVDLPAGTSPDEGAQAFWAAVGGLWKHMRPNACRKCSP